MLLTYKTIKPLTDHLASLTDTELLKLFDMIELSVSVLETSCEESRILQEFMLAFWQSTRAKVL